MKMQILDKQPLGQTLLQVHKDKLRKTSRIYYSNQNARNKNEKKMTRNKFAQKFKNNTASYHLAST
jgi:hypothetical protein